MTHIAGGESINDLHILRRSDPERHPSLVSHAVSPGDHHAVAAVL